MTLMITHFSALFVGFLEPSQRLYSFWWCKAWAVIPGNSLKRRRQSTMKRNT